MPGSTDAGPTVPIPKPPRKPSDSNSFHTPTREFQKASTIGAIELAREIPRRAAGVTRLIFLPVRTTDRSMGTLARVPERRPDEEKVAGTYYLTADGILVNVP